MMRTALRMVMGLSLVVGGIAGLAPAASADVDPPWLLTQLKLSVVPQAGGPGRTATLTCDPAGGTHPKAEVACAELAAAYGDVARVPPQPMLCLAVWEPVDTTVTGFWKGRSVEYSETSSNDGCARIEHGHVLDF